MFVCISMCVCGGGGLQNEVKLNGMDEERGTT